MFLVTLALRQTTHAGGKPASTMMTRDTLNDVDAERTKIREAWWGSSITVREKKKRRAFLTR